MDVSNGAERMNVFAIVVYIPDPLATFLDDLRRELVPGCLPRAHVTMLPPRPLAADVASAIRHAGTVVSGCAPFDIAAGEIQIFPETHVIYLGIKDGERELREMYCALNLGPLAFKEAFPYYPHITLAQGLIPEDVWPLCDLARERWAAFRHSRRLRAERACFVQSTVESTWIDLAEFRLSGVPVG